MNKIEIKNLDLYYGDFQALKNINLEIRDKQITSFIGPSGCGKSTLLKSINRMNDMVEGCRITGQILLQQEELIRIPDGHNGGDRGNGRNGSNNMCDRGDGRDGRHNGGDRGNGRNGLKGLNGHNGRHNGCDRGDRRDGHNGGDGNDGNNDRNRRNGHDGQMEKLNKLNSLNILDKACDVNLLRKNVGMVFQKPNPFPMSIYDNIAYGPRTHGIKKRTELDQIVEEALRNAAIWDELKDKLKKSALELSGGQQQRLCIARALAVQPEVLLMDEPTSALDPISTSKIEDCLLTLKESYTIVIVTHNMQQAVRISDRTVFFLLGEIIEVGETEELFSRPKMKKTEDYITGRFG